LVPEIARAVHPYLDVPYAFFGHSLGALVAFELARYLRRETERTPAHLFVAARRSPERPEPRHPIHPLADREFVFEVQRRWGGIPAEVLKEPDLLALLLPALRADVTMIETYTYVLDEALDFPISCFGGLDDSTVTKEDLEAWKEHTRAHFEMIVFPGTHFFLQSSRAPLLDVLSRHLHPLAQSGPAQ
jgi:medium-chain acyl-[acyl-carrier-protein] hydrolase